MIVEVLGSVALTMAPFLVALAIAGVIHLVRDRGRDTEDHEETT